MEHNKYTSKTLEHNNHVKDLHPILLSILKKRGMSFENIDDYLNFDLKQLPDIVSHLKDIDKATQRICHAINHKEKIAIFGDYDVDGTTSCAFNPSFLRNDTDSSCYISTRQI